jgi:hypothetical protein
MIDYCCRGAPTPQLIDPLPSGRCALVAEQTMHRRGFVLTAALAATVAAPILSSFAQDAINPTGQNGVLAAQRIKRASRALLDGLSEDQRRAIMFSLNADERVQWSNLPTANVPRTGLRIGDLDVPALRLVHALLRASASS